MKDNSTAQLLPCPFCGGRAERHDGQGRMHTIACSKCHALSDYSGKAGKLWNTRAPVSQDAAQLVERVFAMLCQKYVQQANVRQRAMGLQYTEAETHDLAETIAAFIEALTRVQPSTGLDIVDEPTGARNGE